MGVPAGIPARSALSHASCGWSMRASQERSSVGLDGVKHDEVVALVIEGVVGRPDALLIQLLAVAGAAGSMPLLANRPKWS